MNSDILFTSTIDDYLDMDHSGVHLNTLADNFHSAALDLLQKLELVMNNQDHTIWLLHLHTLKGIAGIAGAKNLCDLCDTLRSRNNCTLNDTSAVIIWQLRDAIDHYQVAIQRKLTSIRDNKIKVCR